MVDKEKYKIYPNDLCPCGSGKKYKKCCGKPVHIVNCEEEVKTLQDACILYDINYLKGLELNEKFNRNLIKVCEEMKAIKEKRDKLKSDMKLNLKKEMESIMKFSIILNQLLPNNYR